VVVALIFLWVGYGLWLLGGLSIIVLAWQKGILWGLGCLLFPPIQIFYVALNWKHAKSAFFLLLAGFVAFFISGAIGK
jgi:hypothetical protein